MQNAIDIRKAVKRTEDTKQDWQTILCQIEEFIHCRMSLHLVNHLYT